MGSLRLIKLSFGVGLAIAASTMAATATTVLSDGTFANATPTSTFTSDPSGTTVNPSVCSNCGNPGAALTNTFDSTNSAATGSISSAAGYIDNLLSYTPSIQGAITSINAFADKNVTFTGLPANQLGIQGNSFRLALEQDNKFYVATSGAPTWNCASSTTCSSGWVQLSALGLTAANFVLFDFATNTSNPTAHPNFAGDEILFGVQFGSSTVKGQSATAAYDNLNIAINPVPIPAALPLFASGLVAMGLIGWRRKRKAALAA